MTGGTRPTRSIPWTSSSQYPNWITGRLSDHPGLSTSYIREMAAPAATASSSLGVDGNPWRTVTFAFRLRIPPRGPHVYNRIRASLTANGLPPDRFGVPFERRMEGADVPRELGPGRAIIAAWRTNSRATTYLVEHLPAAAWSRQVPGIPRLKVGMIAAHIHNSRCSWIRAIGARHGIKVPRLVDLRRVRPKELVLALSRSSQGMISLIELGIARGGRVPRARWQNFPTDLEHFLSYFAAHEAHHRGQLVMVARQLGHRLPRTVAAGVWQWTRLAREWRDAEQ